MEHRIIKIDDDKCNGCGLCVSACHEGAIGMVKGKAKLMREDYCDGLGDCLPACPQNAISFEVREAAAYDHQAVERAKNAQSQLNNFPVQLKLVNPMASWLENCDLLIAADCTAFACGDFHSRFLKDRVTVIGCPKLDGVSYEEKLTQILTLHNVHSITVVRMQVPCCGGLVFQVKNAIENSGKDIPLQICILSPDGKLVE